jgi:hypothetical protein
LGYGAISNAYFEMFSRQRCSHVLVARKIGTVDFFEPFIEQIKSALQTKRLRSIEPKAGKIDFDLEGPIQWNWFEKVTGDYNASSIDPSPNNYWDDHLTFAYDSVLPDQVRVSIGFPTKITNDSCKVCFGVWDQEQCTHA